MIRAIGKFSERHGDLDHIGRDSLRTDRPFLFGVHFIHAVLKEGPAVLAFQIPFVRKILACIHLVPLASLAERLDISGFADAALEEILAIIPF